MGNGIAISLGISTEKIIRASKGKSLLSIVNDYTVIDIETTGLDPSFNEIIEIGAIHVRDGCQTDCFESFVRPFNKIDAFITELTGITNEMLSDAPTIESVLPKFLSFVSNDIIVGHNVNFDINFLYDACNPLHNMPLSNNFIDTMRMSRRLFPKLEDHRLSTLVTELRVKQEVMHRGLGDCAATFGCYEAMKSAIQKDASLADRLVILPHGGVKAAGISATTDNFNSEHPLYGKVCVFTGVLEKMTRKEAMQLVVNLGAICGDGVTEKTNYLILGNNDYCSTIKDGKSSKQKKAEKLKLKGNEIEIISENVFYDLIKE